MQDAKGVIVGGGLGNAATVASTFASIRRDLGEIDVLLYNAGDSVFKDVETITPDQFEQS